MADTLKDFPLLDLPAEIRLMIYGHLFASLLLKTLLEAGVTYKQAEPTALLESCRLIRWEVNAELQKFLTTWNFKPAFDEETSKSKIRQVYHDINRTSNGARLYRGDDGYVSVLTVRDSKESRVTRARTLVTGLWNRCTAREQIRTGSAFRRAVVTRQMRYSKTAAAQHRCKPSRSWVEADGRVWDL